MSGFDDFMSKAEAAAKTAAGAARRGAEQAKLAIQIAAEEDKLKTAYAQLGKLTYDAIRAGADPDDAALEQKMETIRKHLEAIRELRRRKESYASQDAARPASKPDAREEDFVEIVQA